MENNIKILDFSLPDACIADSPCEVRGIERDHTRLLVSFVSQNRNVSTKFFNIIEYLNSGDVLVVNTSATIPATLYATRKNGQILKLRLSQKIQFDLWITDIIYDEGELPELEIGEVIELDSNGKGILAAPYQRPYAKDSQYWIISFDTEKPFLDYLNQHALPIRFSHHSQQWSIESFQTVFGHVPGSVEMPSASRGFTDSIVTKLVTKGVQIVPLILHAGTNSEGHIPPHEEYYHVSLETTQVINTARKAKRRIIAIGSTVLRTLETVTDMNLETHPGQGWTSKIISSSEKIRSVDAILTCLHNPKSTHIEILSNFCSDDFISRAYSEAFREGFLWDEFGDFHLILP